MKTRMYGSVALAVAAPHAVHAGDLIQSGARITGENCLAVNTASSVVRNYWCNGGSDQLFEMSDLTTIKVNDQCLQYSSDDAVKMAVCSGAADQQWRARYDGTIMAVGTAKFAKCLQAAAGRFDAATLQTCNPSAPAQVFHSSALKIQTNEVLYAGGPNRCLDWTGVLPVPYACHGGANQLWSYTAASELRVNSTADQCLQYDDVGWQFVTLTKCTGADKQQWTLSSGRVKAAKKPTLCLDFSTSPATLSTCSTTSATQAFDVQPVLDACARDTAPQPPTTSQQATYCAGRNAAANKGTNALPFLRTTVTSTGSDFKYLVPTVLSDKQAYNYYSSVVRETLSMALGLTLGYTPVAESDIVAKLVAMASGSQVLVELAEVMCQVREKSPELIPRIDSLLNIDKPANDRLSGIVSFLRVGNLQLLGSGLLPFDAASLKLASESVAKAINPNLEAAVASGGLPGLLELIQLDDFKGFSEGVQSMCKVNSTLAVCGIVLLRSLSDDKDALASAIKEASSSAETFLTETVKTAAAAFMDAYHKGVAVGSPVNPAWWTPLAQRMVFGSPAVTAFTQAALERAMTISTVVLPLSVWPYFTDTEIQSPAWKPLFAPISEQLYPVRRKVISRLVYRSSASSLEAYMDGRTSDMASLVNDALVPICKAFASLYAMCDLIKFYSLTTARAELQRTLVAQYGEWTENVTALGATFAETYTSKLALNDELWTPMATRLVFNTLQLQVLDSSSLTTTARPASYLLSYVVLEQYTNDMAPLLPFYTFLLDQITPAHYIAINALMGNRDVDGMAAYLDAANNATISDLGVMGTSVLLHVCNNPNNPAFSICKLQDFYLGLLQVVAFEKARAQASTVSLVDLVEVDVRKQLDVVDGENKQFEIMTSIQEAANQIGAKIVEESGKIQAIVKLKSATTRADLDAKIKELNDSMDEDSRRLQEQIDRSTRQLETAVGAAANSLRSQINSATERLYDKIGQEGQTIRTKIDESTRTLTKVINTSTEKLGAKIDASTKEIAGKVQAGFTALGNYFKSDSKASLTTLLAQIKSSQTGTKELVDTLLGRVNGLLEALARSKSDANGAGGGQLVVLAADTAIQAGRVVQESGKCANIFAWASGSVDPVAIAEAGAEIAKLATQMQRVAEDLAELKYKSNEFNAAAQSLMSAVGQFTAAQQSLKELVTKLNKFASGTVKPNEAKALVSTILTLYTKFDLGVSATQISTLADVTSSYLDIIVGLIDGQSAGFPAVAMYGMRRAKDQVTPVFSALQELYDEFNGQWEQLGQAARSAANSQSADAIGASQARRRLRALEDASAPFKPFYALEYAGLSRLFMQYRIQKAAFDFCKFYEYKLGGVAPSMCATPAKFYTPSDIQKMRAYAAPTLRSYTFTALLPTRPTPIGSDLATAVQRPRPYLDLDRLVAGQKVGFTLPIDDLAWLKKYLWARSTDTESSLAGVYIQSMQVVLPFTLAANQTASGETFTMVSTVEFGRSQRLNSKSNRMYSVPPASLRFESSLYEPFCSNEIVNPYHQSAKCISEDGSSTLCVIEDGSTPRTDLLPSLFSSWEISSPKQLIDQPGRKFKLALPSTTTDAADLNVVVQLKVIRVTAPGVASPNIAPLASPKCCAADAYYLKTACAKCPAGSTGALNGYSCQRV